MNDETRALLAELARTAGDSGPALEPAGHQQLLRSITDAARGVFSAAACSLALLTEDETELVFHVASGAGADEVVGLRVPVDQGIAGWVVTSGQPIAIEDVASDPRFATGVADETGYRPTSILAMPLQTERSMIGVIEVLDRDASSRDGSQDMQVLGLFATQAALAIENSRVFSDLGRVLLEALARSTEGDLSMGLRATAENAEGPTREIAEIAGLLRALGQAGPNERRLAATVLNEFMSYIRTRRWQS